MYIAEFYDFKKTYVTQDGQLVDKEEFYKQYPAAKSIKMVVFLEGNALMEAYTFDYLQAHYSIPYNFDDNGKLALIQKMVNDEKTENSPLERIASALEYLAMTAIQEG